MIQLKDVSTVVTPVKIQRGPLELDLTCFSERISPENEEYATLLEEAQKIDLEIQTSQQVLELLCLPHYAESFLEALIYVDDTGAIISPESEPQKAKKKASSGRVPTPDEVKAREDELTARIEEKAKAVKGALLKSYENKAKRICYLTESWSILDGEKQAKIEPAVITANFSKALIDQTLEAIEGTVFGPLALLPGSGDS